jgi:alpha-amylase/alpha-mannosidase (GH57 family)
MRKLQAHLSLFEELIGECNKKNLRIENQLPDLVKLYQRLLTDANHFYTEVKQDSTFLRDLQIDQWAHFTHASSQFAAEVGTALAAVYADTNDSRR